MTKSGGRLLCTLLLSAPAAAQTPAAGAAQPAASPAAASYVPAPAPALTPAAIIAPLPANRAILRAGTEVPVRLVEEVTTKGKKLHVGQRVRMETADAVVYQGLIVVPANSPVTGEITDVVNKGMSGKSGHVGLRVLYVTVNGRQIRLSGAIDDKGVAGGVAAVAVSAVVFLPAGFFMTGTSAKLPVGTAFKAFLDEDLQLEIAAIAPGPMVIGAPQTMPVSAAVPAASAVPAALPPGAAPAARPAVPAATTIAVATTPAPAPAPAPAAVPGPPRAVASTPSGYCLDVPKGYKGTGSPDYPLLTVAAPACSSIGRK